MKISDVLHRRTDLSTFIVHLTKDKDGVSAKDCLKSIIADDELKAVNVFGQAANRIHDYPLVAETQKCVCFTEATLENLYLFFQEIEGRDCRFRPYGIAIPKKLARKYGVNPIWYIDITPARGGEWLTKPLDLLIEAALKQREPEKEPIFKITPYIEQMGSGAGEGYKYKKEFWWEREWRYCGDFTLPDYIVLCPENEIEEFKECCNKKREHRKLSCIDPMWGIEMIISRLAGFRKSELESL